MSLVNRLRTGLKTVSTSFSTSSGDYLLRNGYYDIYRQVYGLGYVSSIAAQMSESRALTLSAFYAGVKIISEDVGSCSLLTFEQRDGQQVEAVNHELYGKLRWSPNPDMTTMQFREALTGHAIMCGKGFARKEFSRGDSDRIIALWPMMPYEIRRDKDRSGRMVFIWMPKGQPAETLQSQQVFQLNGFGLTGYDGLNLLEYARTSLGLSLAQQEYAERFFAQDQTPNIVLKHPGKLGPSGVEGVKEAWMGRRADGTRKTPSEWWHEPRVLQEGMDLTQLHPDAQKSQLIEQRVFQLLEVCRLLRMPPHKLAEMGRATWGNIGDENRSYYTGTLRPWFIRWEQALKLQCYGVDTPYFAEHDAEDLLRGDYKSQTEGLSRLQGAGTLSINEARAILNYNPIEGGDEHLVQVNMQTVQALADALLNGGANNKPQ